MKNFSQPLHVLLLLTLAACGSEKSTGPQLSREPVSVRGWISDVTSGPKPTFQVVSGETQRKLILFQQTYVSVDNAPFASGGVAENGSFIILDVPPGDVVLTFTAPEVPAAKIQLRGIPPNSDVYLDEITLTPGGVKLIRPEKILVRVPGDSKLTKREEMASESFADLARLRVVRAPLLELSDRRDYPVPKSTGFVATVK